jgi:hypothetical protein
MFYELAASEWGKVVSKLAKVLNLSLQKPTTLS